jgi:hypothetical protein
MTWMKPGKPIGFARIPVYDRSNRRQIGVVSAVVGVLDAEALREPAADISKCGGIQLLAR